MKNLTAILLIITLCLSGCTGKIFGGNNTEQQNSSPVHGSANTTADDMGVQEFTFPAYSEIFTERDKAGTYDESEAVYITCSSDGFECADNTVTVKMNSCIIQKEGVYVVSGNCDNGQICVNAPENAKVQIVLAGLSLSSETSSAILIKSAKKVFITPAQGTENTLSDGEVYNTASNEDAVIFSKADLTLNGSGTLNLTGNYQHACVSKDDLTVTGGTYNITAKASGLSAKDAVEICGGDIRVQAGTDAVRAKNDEDSTKGNVFIYGGSFTLHSQGDGISASANMLIEDGKFDIKTAGGSDEVEQNMGNGR
ncbi:MAG: carbohydrate-binding domain-containing protein, partial [Clostridia bacterium]|nr:carbohydrate-binding domain-containing protein [Clostridia bacterium]